MSKSLQKPKQSVKTLNSKTHTTKKSESKLKSIAYTDISAILALQRAKHTISPDVSEFELIETKQDSKVQEQRFQQALMLLKGILFKADMPYRTKLPFSGFFATNASGLLNQTISVSTLASAQEWSSIDALFDECFVHAIHFRYFTLNDNGGGTGYSTTAGASGAPALVTGNYIVSGPICMCSLFSGATAYTSASALVQNATLAIHSSSKPFKYVWRNNTKFEKHGISLSPTTNLGWLGWTSVSQVASMSGQIQFRVITDPTFGPGSTAINLGAYIAQYDVSFRARS